MGCEGRAGLRGRGPHSPPAAHHLPFLLWQKNKKSWKPQDNDVNSRKWTRQQVQSPSASQQVRPKSCWQLSRATLAGCPQRSPNPSPAEDGSPERPSPAAVASTLGRHPVVQTAEATQAASCEARPRGQVLWETQAAHWEELQTHPLRLRQPAEGLCRGDRQHSPRGQRHLQRQQLVRMKTAGWAHLDVDLGDSSVPMDWAALGTEGAQEARGLSQLVGAAETPLLESWRRRVSL